MPCILSLYAAISVLTRIAILVDQSQLHEVVEVFSSMWIKALKQEVPQSLQGQSPSSLGLF
jgi:hypothetical protein